jgi:hypothetical protein
MGRAEQVRDKIIHLGWEEHYLLLEDLAVDVRHPDGSFTFDRKRFSGLTNILAPNALPARSKLVGARGSTGLPARSKLVQ